MLSHSSLFSFCGAAAWLTQAISAAFEVLHWIEAEFNFRFSNVKLQCRCRIAGWLAIGRSSGWFAAGRVAAVRRFWTLGGTLWTVALGWLVTAALAATLATATLAATLATAALATTLATAALAATLASAGYGWDWLVASGAGTVVIASVNAAIITDCIKEFAHFTVPARAIAVTIAALPTTVAITATFRPRIMAPTAAIAPASIAPLGLGLGQWFVFQAFVGDSLVFFDSIFNCSVESEGGTQIDDEEYNQKFDHFNWGESSPAFIGLAVAIYINFGMPGMPTIPSIPLSPTFYCPI
jgi:hypothetical protein